MNGLPFHENEVSFRNLQDGITLSGTITIPDTEFDHPCVILISGSGPQTRDQNIVGHAIFRDIAHYFSRNGIGVLRFDDRGVGKSEGVFDTAGFLDFRNDVISAFSFLHSYSGINKQKIGVLGHSIGGLLAPMVALELKDQLAFLVSLAGPGMVGYDLYTLQHSLIAKAQGASDVLIEQMTISNKKICDLILSLDDKKELMKKIKAVSWEEHQKKPLMVQLYEKIKMEILYLLYHKSFQIYIQPWFKEWLMINPGDYWQKVQCPVLAINGGRDLQVPPENLTLIEHYLKQGNNPAVETQHFPEMNHLFQKAESGLPEEYATIQSSISPDVLGFIGDWINRQ